MTKTKQHNKHVQECVGRWCEQGHREGPGHAGHTGSRSEERGKLADLSSPCSGKAWTVEQRREERAPAYRICSNDLFLKSR